MTTKPGIFTGTRGKRPETWTREEGRPFHEAAREVYAQERAKGGTIKASAQEAGIAYVTAMDWDKRGAMRSRILELRRSAETFCGVSKTQILNELMTNAMQARESGAFKASNEALIAVYRIVNEDKDVGHQMARAIPAEVNRNQLRAMLRESFPAPTERAPEPIVVEAEGEPAPVPEADLADTAPVEDEEAAE